MLNQYKNIEEIKTAKGAVSADRINRTKKEFLSYDLQQTYFSNKDILNVTNDSRLELHVYSGDNWITGNHKISFRTKIPKFRDQKNNLINIDSGIGIDLYSQLQSLKLTSGKFKFAINFFKNLIGSYEHQHLRIDEISPDRTEIRLRAIDDQDPEFLQQITKYIQTVDQTGSITYKTYLLNFSRNQTILFVNSVVIGEYLYVKLHEPLPEQYQVDFKCWVVEEQKQPYIDNVSILSKVVTKQFNTLSGPNWQANYSFDTSAETELKTWTDLLGSSIQTSQQIVDSYFSGSLGTVKLNIDYSDFNNFIFYSSATERLSNFRYKLELIEYYTSQSNYISTLSGSVPTTNAEDFTSLKTTLIGGFDSFEQYLYYQSSSILTTNNIPSISATVPDLTGSYITPVPKINTSKPYITYSVNSVEFKDWYDSLYVTASQYDSLNYNSLLNTIPEYIRFDSSNENLLIFTNMLGQHYDIIHSYIHNMTKINSREENPKLGMPNELLYSVAKQFGWNLTNGQQSSDLWEYVLGTNEAGIPYTGSLSVGDPAISKQDMTYTVWRRIVNNIPMLLKSKGTKRSIYALLACYGIPKSFLTIKEYGGPRIDRAPVYEKLNFDYALDLSGSSSGTVSVNYSQSLQTIEMRFRTADVLKYPTLPSTMNLYTIGSNAVTIDFSSGTMGSIQINGTSSADFEIFNGDWITTTLRARGTNLDIIAKKSKYGKIVTTVSASATGSIPYSNTLTIGSTSTGASRLIGQIQELRFWSSSLQDSVINNHTKAPGAYDGNSDTYSELIFRLPLNQNINHSLTSSMQGVQPAPSEISASFIGWSLATPYDSIEETYYYDAPSIGGGTYDDNKIRLESNELVGTLDVKSRAERSQFDKAPLDSNRLGVYFSPQTMIDEDIIAHLGFEDYDDYIGDPGSVNTKSYPDLIRVAQSYWKKYQNKNDINSYINMFTLFDLSFFKQLEQLLPARADKITGILIQPNLLERSKDIILPVINRFISNYDAVIYQISPTASSEYIFLNANVDGNILSVSGEDDNQWQAYLTASTAEKYDSMPYSYEYIIRSGSTWITASSPYWLSDVLQPIYINSIPSTTKLIDGTQTYTTASGGSGITATYGTGTYGTSTYYSDPVGAGWFGTLADVQDYLPTGIRNQRYAGCKLTSPAFNISSPQTIDGGPVVEWRTSNPNQLIYQQYNNQGSFVLQ